MQKAGYGEGCEEDVMVIRQTVCRDCDNAIPHNTECCPGYVPAAPFDYYRNTDRRRCPLTSLLVLTLPVGLCRQCLTHRLPGNTRKPQQRSVMPENRPITTHTSVHHSLLISNSLLSLYHLTFAVLSWLPTTALQQT